MTFKQLLALVASQKGFSVRVDSRLVESGDVFVALKGTTFDGHDFIKQSLDAGAKFIVAERAAGQKDEKIIIVDNSSIAAGELAQACRGRPGAGLTNLAVTGTNGKTTVAFLVRSAIENTGKKCGLISTVLQHTCRDEYKAELTTPDAVTIAKRQAEMLAAGAEYMVIEASSHSLKQNRLAGIEFRAAAFTNLTSEHLDYHKSEEKYLAAKTKLFKSLSPNAVAVLNKQSGHCESIAKSTNANIIRYAVDEPADLTAEIQSMDISGTSLSVRYGGRSVELKTALFGRFNVSNILAAAGLCLAAGFSLEETSIGLGRLKVVPGRLHPIRTHTDFSVLVDYAHTEDALKNVLSGLKAFCKGNLTVVFGCGGDRDKSKRAKMAEVAEKFADKVIVTSDNPRTEDPEFIIGQIITGFASPAVDTILVEPDRRKAIQLAIKTAEKDDIIVIAGKGHETEQVIGTKRFDFNDMQVVEKCFREQNRKNNRDHY